MKSRNRLRDYCILIRSLKEILSPVNYLVLKLYRGYNESEYKPQDIDIFIGKDPRRILYVLKGIKETFPESEAVRRKHVSLSINVFIHRYSLDVDLYSEVVFSPILILDEIPKDVKIMAIPWCREIEVPSLGLSLNVFHMLIHALRHKRLYDYEIFSLIKDLNDFNLTDCKNFLLHVKESGLEVIVVPLLKLILYYSMFILRIPVTQYSLFYRNTLKIIRVLAKEKAGVGLIDGLIDNMVKLALRRASSRYVGLWFVFPLYVLRSLVLAFKILSRRSINALSKIIFIYLFYEYVITLFDKLGLLK